MPKRMNLQRKKTKYVKSIADAIQRYDDAIANDLDASLLRWIAKMSALEVHTGWERYVEDRLVVALNNDARHFIKENDIRGVKHLSSGFATYVALNGRHYFDFRSMSDLFKQGDNLIGKDANPFRSMPLADRKEIDCLAAIRNWIVHGSDNALSAYKKHLGIAYEMKYVPVDEFLPVAGKGNRSRLHGLANVVIKSIEAT